MTYLKGITVKLYDQVTTGLDPFGKPIIDQVEIDVDNVLVSPTTTDDITTSINLTGRKAIYQMAIPKGDTNDWENKEVEFFNQRWRTFGIPTEGIEDLIPLSWNKKVMVERYE